METTMPTNESLASSEKKYPAKQKFKGKCPHCKKAAEMFLYDYAWNKTELTLFMQCSMCNKEFKIVNLKSYWEID